ncbi:hypothetical protein CAC42_2652 [Sphaceloma murrayae]|uniref:Uncharacterized protein n=1 Tax=Sphaceloma murrayae TaxID=2082308 RepID=A0A2K1QHH2_9PEZI|nr:hypothetical protein CAC42_2652 [Sphaceloma murrayae]
MLSTSNQSSPWQQWHLRQSALQFSDSRTLPPSLSATSSPSRPFHVGSCYQPPMGSPLGGHAWNRSSLSHSAASADAGSETNSSGTRPPRAAPGPPSARAGFAQDARIRARRKAFISKVRQGGDDRRWETRSKDLETLDRAEWEREMRLWAEEREREGPTTQEQEDIIVSGHKSMNDETQAQSIEAEDIAMREEEEMQELLQMMDIKPSTMKVEIPPDGPHKHCFEADGHSESYGSDDDEYELLFQEMLSQTHADEDAMDTGL